MSFTKRLTNDGQIMLFEDAEYDPKVGDTSGLIPYGRILVVKMDTLSKYMSETSGLLNPDSIQEKRNVGSTTGCIVAIGSEAFTKHENMSPWTGPRPQVGDRVHVVQYSGAWTGGRDGLCYRLVDQNCILSGEAPWPQEAAPAQKPRLQKAIVQ